MRLAVNQRRFPLYLVCLWLWERLYLCKEGFLFGKLLATDTYWCTVRAGKRYEVRKRGMVKKGYTLRTERNHLNPFTLASVFYLQGNVRGK